MSGQPFPTVASGPARAEGPGDRSRRVGRRILVALLALAVAAAVGWWLWVAATWSSPPVRWQPLGFQTVSERAVEIRWSVDRDPGLTVECVIRARNFAGAEVGRARVPVPSGATESVEVRHTLTTSDLAVTGEVLACLPSGG